MIQVPDRRLWLGTAADLRDPRRTLSTGVRAIVDLAIEEPVPSLPRTVTYCRFELTDDGEDADHIIRAAILATSALIGAVDTAVCCSAGRNRSAVIAAAALSHAFKCEVGEQLREISVLKPLDVNPALWSRVVAVSDLIAN